MAGYDANGELELGLPQKKKKEELERPQTVRFQQQKNGLPLRLRNTKGTKYQLLLFHFPIKSLLYHANAKSCPPDSTASKCGSPHKKKVKF